MVCAEQPLLEIPRPSATRLDWGRLRETPKQFVSTPKGSGPRHFIFRKDGMTGYVVDEIASSVSQYDFDSLDGSLNRRMTASTLPASFRGQNSSADIHLSPDERFLYFSNRGHNSIAVFEVDHETSHVCAKRKHLFGRRIAAQLCYHIVGAIFDCCQSGHQFVGGFRTRREQRIASEDQPDVCRHANARQNLAAIVIFINGW
ncbi:MULTISPECIES: beta-propeller fold lactonase family protein [unclassified Mesorhizobium]|uniref:lactonase family protein n=1 Tax=unclassified Mesorhizobium TaxID=325217 RepID=UPI001FDEE3D1|nr:MULTISPECIES: beta-propeller fold lactonase family protein [unclassified Mesorhizobium]